MLGFGHEVSSKEAVFRNGLLRMGLGHEGSAFVHDEEDLFKHESAISCWMNSESGEIQL